MSLNKRQIHYINPPIQQRLIISLIFIELILIGSTISWLYLDLNHLIEENMFKIHIQNTLTAEFFAIRIAQAALILLIFNIVIASIVVWLWRKHINKIITPLYDIADSIQKLDFTFKPVLSVQHESSQVAADWFRKEKETLSQIRYYISMIDVNKPDSILVNLTKCKALLPNNTPIKK